MTAHGLWDASATTTPGRPGSAIIRAASIASESSCTIRNCSSRSSARTEPQYGEIATLGEVEVTKPQIAEGQHERHCGHDRASFGEVPERNAIAGSICDPDRDDVRAGADGGEVAAKYGAQQQGPPQHARARVPGNRVGELSDDRCHRGGVRDVVDEAAQREGNGEDQDGRRPRI